MGGDRNRRRGAIGKVGRMVAKGRRKVKENENGEGWILRLYVAGQTAKSIAALANLQKFAEANLVGYTIEVVDLLKTPQFAKGDQIFAVPTLVRRLPPPVKKIIGDLSNTERILVGLEIKPAR